MWDAGMLTGVPAPPQPLNQWRRPQTDDHTRAGAATSILAAWVSSACTLSSGAMPLTQRESAEDHTWPITRAMPSASSPRSGPSAVTTSARNCVSTSSLCSIAAGEVVPSARINAPISVGRFWVSAAERSSKKMSRSPGVSPAATGLDPATGASQPAGEAGDEHLVLAGVIAVDRAERDTRLLGHGTHLHGLVPALARHAHGGLQDSDAALLLRLRASGLVGHWSTVDESTPAMRIEFVVRRRTEPLPCDVEVRQRRADWSGFRCRRWWWKFRIRLRFRLVAAHRAENVDTGRRLDLLGERDDRTRQLRHEAGNPPA